MGVQHNILVGGRWNQVDQVINYPKSTARQWIAARASVVDLLNMGWHLLLALPEVNSYSVSPFAIYS